MAEGKVSHHLPSKVLKHSLPQVEAQVTLVDSEAKAARVMAEAKAGVCFPIKEEISLPHPLRLKAHLEWWQVNSTREVLNLIQDGVAAPWAPGCGPNLPRHCAVRSLHQEQLVLDLLQEYLAIGAVVELVCPQSLSVPQFLDQWGVRHLVPWFVISKAEGTSQKHRLITDCRKVNRFLQAPHFKMDHWGQIFPFVRRGMWACKVDLKHAYFHLPLAKNLQEYLVLQVKDRFFQFQAAPFGLSHLPFLWTQVMKSLVKAWRQKGINSFVYLDDVLVLAKSPNKLAKDMVYVLDTLAQSGLQINYKKSVLQPTQKVQHLGFLLDLEKGLLQVPVEKLSFMRKELKQLDSKKFLTPRKMASILGALRSFLTAFPPLRSFTDLMLAFVRQHQQFHWDKSLPIPPPLQGEVQKLLDLMSVWKGRSLDGRVPVRQLHSDSSDTMWAGVDLHTQSRVQEYWRGEGVLHITVKELKAAVDTVRSLAQPGEVVQLGVDNSVAYYYLLKGGGGRLPHLNQLMREFWDWCLQKNILVKVHLLKSADDLADKYTRLGMDKGDYTLEDNLFLHLKSRAFSNLGGDHAPPPPCGTCSPVQGMQKAAFFVPVFPTGKPRKWTLCRAPWRT